MPSYLRWFAVVLTACAGGPPVSESPDSPPPPVPTGLVSEPVHGTVIAGDPLGITIRVAGTYSDSSRELAIQMLSNPDDLASWQTIATTTATTPQDATFGFAVDVQPVATEAERPRWPSGGVLRMRVVDDAGAPLPLDPADATDTVLAVVNPAGLPAGWTYLSEKPVGSAAETALYYAAIAAPATLDAFITTYGFATSEVKAVYYNAGDLGIGREMHCRATETPAGGLACYVRNYGVFGGSKDDAIAQTVAAGIPLATVAMVYTPPITAPNSVAFMVYGPDNALIDEAQLDTRGDNKSIPQNCLNCHGGRATYDEINHVVNGARFLPFDPSAFEYAAEPTLTLAAQEENFRQLDRLVAAAAPPAGVTEMIEGMFPLNNSPYDPLFVPATWAETPRDARVYREVIAPYCRSCHASFELGVDDPAAFPTAATLKARAASAAQRICGEGPKGMPTAEQTTLKFFDSSARALLMTWLDRPGACAPAVAPLP